MRSIGAFSLTVGLGLSVIGCGSTPEGGTLPSPSPDSAFAARFESAAALSDEAQRNKDFAKVATDAAGVGDVDATRNSLLRIKNDSLRDSTAYKSALLLVKAGQKRAASSLVRMIKDNALQQKLTAKIAKGETSE